RARHDRLHVDLHERPDTVTLRGANDVVEVAEGRVAEWEVRRLAVVLRNGDAYARRAEPRRTPHRAVDGVTVAARGVGADVRQREAGVVTQRADVASVVDERGEGPCAAVR